MPAYRVRIGDRVARIEAANPPHAFGLALVENPGRSGEIEVLGESVEQTIAPQSARHVMAIQQKAGG